MKHPKDNFLSLVIIFFSGSGLLLKYSNQNSNQKSVVIYSFRQNKLSFVCRLDLIKILQVENCEILPEYLKIRILGVF